MASVSCELRNVGIDVGIVVAKYVIDVIDRVPPILSDLHIVYL